MIREGLFRTGSASGVDSSAKVDFYIAMLSDKDMKMRRRAVAALGASRDSRAVEPLMFALSREISLGAESFVVVMDVVEALACMPDSHALDQMLKIESQLIDYGSPGCRADLPVGAVVYHSKGDRHVDRIVPREVHYKVFEGLRRISNALGDRTELVAGRFHDYQLKVMEEEIDRLLPRMSDVLTESQSESLPADVVMQDTMPEDEEAVSGNCFDHELIKQQMEAQILDYISKNEDILTIIQNGQRLKAGIQQARESKGKLALDMTVRSAWALVR